MNSKTAMALFALFAVMFMQTGLCPKCVFSQCNHKHTADHMQPKVAHCCSEKKMEMPEESIPVGQCEGCGETCTGQCYEVETDLVVPASSLDSLTLAPSLLTCLDVNNSESVSTVFRANEKLPDQLEQLPPPDTVRVVDCTELLI